MELMIHRTDKIVSERIYQLDETKSYVKKIRIFSKDREELVLTLFSRNKESLKLVKI